MAIFEFKYKQIGRKIAYYRKLRNLTQEQLARKVNISKSALGKIECGRYNRTISLSMLMTIAEGLNINLELLLKFEELKMDNEISVSSEENLSSKGVDSDLWK